MILEPTAENIEKIITALNQGDIVGLPTETVYGLAGKINSEIAILSIFQHKGRPATNPLIVHVLDLIQLKSVAKVSTEHEKILESLKQFWPGPLTVILPKLPEISDLITAGTDTVAVRIPAHPLFRKIIEECGMPLAAPSANQSTHVSPTTAQHVIEEFGDDLAVLDGGPCQYGLESTVLSLIQTEPTILRPGAVTLEMLQAILPTVKIIFNKSDENTKQISPGQSYLHYAPTTKLILSSKFNWANLDRAGLITFSENLAQYQNQVKAYRQLSINHDLNTAAAKLFATLREFDRLNLDLIVVEPCPEVGIGVAIMDRLRRAVK